MSKLQKTLQLGYGLIVACLLVLAANSVYEASIALHTNQKLQALEREKVQLETTKAALNQHIATQTALKPIQTQLAADFTPITSFFTAMRHSTVALR